MDVRDALLQRIQSRMLRMRSNLERFDDRTAERCLVSLDWNVRDLVGHFAYWADEGAKQIPILAAGGKKKDYDIERHNAEAYKQNRRMSFVMLLPRLREGEERFLAAVKAVKQELLIGETLVREWIEDVGIEHYDVHRRRLEQAGERLD